jgi:rubrerythrin
VSARVKSSPIKGAAREHARAPERDATPANDAPRTLAEFMALALLMETEAAQRYAELADAMETHNNREVADLFRRLADIESRHAQKIVVEMDWREAPVLAPSLRGWASFEAPETAPSEDVHYLMQPYQALQLALAGEERAEQFFARLVRVAKVASVRKAARELRDEEREHVALVKAWMEKVPKPGTDWADDPDPPRYTD